MFTQEEMDEVVEEHREINVAFAEGVAKRQAKDARQEEHRQYQRENTCSTRGVEAAQGAREKRTAWTRSLANHGTKRSRRKVHRRLVPPSTFDPVVDDSFDRPGRLSHEHPSNLSFVLALRVSCIRKLKPFSRRVSFAWILSPSSICASIGL